MKIYVYGFKRNQLPIIHCLFGKADYIDVTEQYQDIMATCADAVVINLEKIKSEILQIIKEYESETKEMEDREYYYLSKEQLDNMSRNNMMKNE